MKRSDLRKLFSIISELQSIELTDRWESAFLGGATEQLLELADMAEVEE